MAIYLPAPPIGEISGKLGSLVYARNHGKRVVRIAATRRKTYSPRLGVAQANYIRARNTFFAFSDDEKAAWSTAGNAIRRINSLGVPYRLTALQAYLSWALPNMLGSLSFSDEPPLMAPANPGTGLSFFWLNPAMLYFGWTRPSGFTAVNGILYGRVSGSPTSRPWGGWRFVKAFSGSADVLFHITSDWVAALGSVNNQQRLEAKWICRLDNRYWSKTQFIEVT